MTTLVLAWGGFGLACTTKPPAEQPELSGPHNVKPSADDPSSADTQVAPAAFANPPTPVAIEAIVQAPDRSPQDRELDAGRKPAELLAFLALQPGMRVAELMAGFGYTAELLARAVGPQGVVYGQNNKFVLERFAQAGWTERLTTPAMKAVVRVDRELDDPLPANANNLDLVIMVLFYHDTFWLNVDRQKMNAAVFRALRPKGRYVIIDHSGRDQSGSSEVKTLHRIEEKIVRAEVEQAGFRVVKSADFLRNPQDTRDWDASPRAAAEHNRRGQSDRFVLAFEKP